MSCAFEKEKLTGYYDGELEAVEKAEVEKHISSCSECLRDLGEIKSAATMVHALPRRRAPRSIAEGVSRELGSSGRVSSFETWRRGLLWGVSVAAAVLVVVNALYFTQRSGTPSSAAAGPAAAPPMAVTDAARAPAEERDGALKELQRQNDRGDEKGKAVDAVKAVEDKDYRRKVEGEKLGATRESKADDAKRFGEPKAEPLAPPRPAAPAAPPPPPPAKSAPPPVLAEKKKSEGTAPRGAEELRRTESNLKQLPEAGAGTVGGGARIAKGQAPAPGYFVVGSGQAVQTRRKAEEFVAKQGWAAVEQAKNAAKDRAQQGQAQAEPLELELTDAQFTQLKKELEASSAVVVAATSEQAALAMAPGQERAESPKAATAAAPKPAAPPTAAPAGRAGKAVESLEKSPPADPAAVPGEKEGRKRLAAEPESAHADKAPAEARRRVILYFVPEEAARKLVPAADKR